MRMLHLQMMYRCHEDCCQVNMTLLSTFSRFILYILGWSLPPTEEIERSLRNLNRAVVVYPHTSMWDFFFALLYQGAYSPLLQANNFRPRFLVAHTFFRNPVSRWFLGSIGAISAPDRGTTGNGTISVIVEQILIRDERTLFFISPKGTRALCPHRSGYYYIAKGLKAPIIKMALDYSRHTLVISSVTEDPTRNDYGEVEANVHWWFSWLPQLRLNREPFEHINVTTSIISYSSPLWLILSFGVSFLVAYCVG